jgi:predicted MPP superfamily phosphohydrolase
VRRLLSGGAILAGVLATAVWLSRFATRWLEVVQLRIELPDLPERWTGVRIAHLSDFHVGANGTSMVMMADVKRAVARFEPDVVALTGDYYDQGVPIGSNDLFANWPTGAQIFAVLGNHDFRGSGKQLAAVIAELEAGGAVVLRNEARAFSLRGATAWVVGVDDPFTWRADETRAFAMLPSTAPALLMLAHSPAAISAIPVGRVGLMLAGHTHGGQVRVLTSGRIPFVRVIRRLRGTPPRRESSAFRGMHWPRGALVVISNGLGVTKLPLRVRTRPQLILIELAPAASDGLACDDAKRYVHRLNPLPRLLRPLS